jgi:hypothetical protein
MLSTPRGVRSDNVGSIALESLEYVTLLQYSRSEKDPHPGTRAALNDYEFDQTARA